MSSGKLTNPDGPGAQSTLGQVLCTDGNTYPFHNTANLEKDEPVIFDLVMYHIKMFGTNTGVPIAVLEEDKNRNPLITKFKNGTYEWEPDFKRKWDEEWNKVNMLQIKDLNLRGKNLNIDSLKKINGCKKPNDEKDPEISKFLKSR